MGTEIKTEAAKAPESLLESGQNLKNQAETLKKTQNPRKCICGCNAPMLYAKRECNIPYSNPRSNFSAILKVFFKENRPPSLTLCGHSIDIYNHFHIIIKVRSQFGRIS